MSPARIFTNSIVNHKRDFGSNSKMTQLQASKEVLSKDRSSVANQIATSGFRARQ